MIKNAKIEKVHFLQLGGGVHARNFENMISR